MKALKLILWVSAIVSLAFYFTTCNNYHELNKCWDDKSYNDDEIENCLTTAKWTARLHFWSDNDPVEEMKEALVYNSLSRVSNFEQAEKLAKRWYLDLNKLAIQYFEKKVTDSWDATNAMAVFRKFGNASWITPQIANKIKMHISGHDCNESEYTDPNCFQALKYACIYDLGLNAQMYFAEKSWTNIVTAYDRISFENVKDLFELNREYKLYSDEITQTLNLIYLVNNLNKQPAKIGDVDKLARELNLLPELRRYAGMPNAAMRILIDRGFLFAD